MASRGGSGVLRHTSAGDGGRSEKPRRETVAAPSKSAAVARLEREVKELRGENSQLKEELSSIKSLYEQLVFEAPREQFSERRVHLLKSQLTHLERQVTVQSQALHLRAQLLIDLSAVMDSILEHGARSDGSGGSGGGREKTGREKTGREGQASEISGDWLVTLTERARALRARISKCSQVCSSAARAPSFPHLPASLLTQPACDVCARRQLNLKYVSGLESKLAQLYGNLTQLQSSLHSLPTTPSSAPSPSPSSSSFVPSSSLLEPLVDRQQSHVRATSDLVADCCRHLLTLSLLAPSSPSLPSTAVPTTSADTAVIISTELLLPRLKPHIRNKKEVKEILQEVVKSVNHADLLHRQKSSALEQELEFHRTVYQLQLDYVSSLFEAVRKGYEAFEAAAQDILCTPLEGILASYSELSLSAGEDTLREFLGRFREREKSLRNIVESLKAPPHEQKGDSFSPQGGMALSAFGEHFFESLRQLERENAVRRRDGYQMGRKVGN